MLVLITALNVSFNNVQSFMGFTSNFFVVVVVATLLKLWQAGKKIESAETKMFRNLIL